MFAIKEVNGAISARQVKKDWPLDEGESLVDEIPEKEKGEELILKNGKVGKRKKKVKSDKDKLIAATGLDEKALKKLLKELMGAS